MVWGEESQRVALDVDAAESGGGTLHPEGPTSYHEADWSLTTEGLQKHRGNTMKNALSRRKFIGATSSALATVTIAPSHVLGLAGQTPPSGKLNIAGVGIGGRGFADVSAVASENIVALCDVDQSYAARGFKQWPDARKYVDFRKMLETQKDIDAVVVGTPDHAHELLTRYIRRNERYAD